MGEGLEHPQKSMRPLRAPHFVSPSKTQKSYLGFSQFHLKLLKAGPPNTDLFGLEGAETFLSSVTSVIYYVWEVPLCLLAPNLGGFFFFCKLTGF